MLTSTQALAFYLQRQFLTTPAPDPEAVPRRLIAIQTQVDSTLPNALWRRCPDVKPDWVESAFNERRSIVKVWTIRQTLHTVAPDDLPLLVAAFGNWMAAERYRHRHKWSNLSDEENAALERGLYEALGDGPMTYDELREAVPEFTIEPYGRELKPLVFRGDVVALDNKRFARRDRWLPDLEWNLPTEADARVELARRYLEGYGPASVHDFAHWSGLRISDSRPAFEALELVPVAIEGWQGDCFLLPEQVEAARAAQEIPPLLLMPKYDVVTLAHKDKTRILDEGHYKQVFKPSAHVEAVVLIDGRVAATWRQKMTKTMLKVALVWSQNLRASDKRLLEAEAQALAAFYGLKPKVEYV